LRARLTVDSTRVRASLLLSRSKTNPLSIFSSPNGSL
jgi:hypothetical protein